MRSCKAVVFRAHLCSDTHTHVRGGPRRFPAARERVELTDLGCMVSGSPLVHKDMACRLSNQPKMDDAQAGNAPSHPANFVVK